MTSMPGVSMRQSVEQWVEKIFIVAATNVEISNKY
jgi:hypothetical protein